MKNVILFFLGRSWKGLKRYAKNILCLANNNLESSANLGGLDSEASKGSLRVPQRLSEQGMHHLN